MDQILSRDLFFVVILGRRNNYLEIDIFKKVYCDVVHFINNAIQIITLLL